MRKKIKSPLSRLTAVLTAGILSMSWLTTSAFADESKSDKPIVVVSLGDSYSSGEANTPFGKSTELKDKVKDEDWLAHRSENSWPGQLVINGKRLNDYRVKSYDASQPVNWFFAAVSGAETRHMSPQLVTMHYKSLSDKAKANFSNDNWKGQEKKYNKMEIKNGFYHYYKNDDNVDYLPFQLDVFDDNNLKGKVDYVTITLGGNDAGFVKIIEETVKAHYTSPAELQNMLDKAEKKWKNEYGIKERLKETYREIKEKAGEQAYIIVAGYPQLMYETDSVYFKTEHCHLVNDKIDDFNNWIRKLVNDCDREFYNGTGHIVFADIEREFDPRGRNGEGLHGANDPREPYINTIIPGAKPDDLDRNALFSAYSMHPNEKGVEAYRKCVQEIINEIEDKAVIQFGKDVEMISTMSGSFAILKNNGDLYAWGANSYGELGTGDTEYRDIPEKIKSDIKYICFSRYHSAYIDNNGDLYSWGSNYRGACGPGVKDSYTTPQKIMSNVKAVSLSIYNGACIKENGDLILWGPDFHMDSLFLKPLVEDGRMSNVKMVSVGDGHCAWIKENGDLYTTGDNTYGQCGWDTYTQPIMHNVKAVSVGFRHSACITENGDLYVWGQNIHGQLGTGDTKNRNTPIKIWQNVKAVSLGSEYSAFITENGDLYTFGENFKGSLGNGKSEDVYVPTRIMQNVKYVVLGENENICVTETGEIFTWGRTNYYIYKDDSFVPKRITNISITKTDKSDTSAASSTTKALKAAPTTADTLVCSDLLPETLYNVYAFKDPANGLTPANLMYINQLTTDGSGELDFDYGLKEDTAVDWIVVPFKTDNNEGAAEVTVVPGFEQNEERTYTDIKLTVNGQEFTADSTGKIVLTGLADGDHEATITKPSYAPRKVSITVGGENADVKICKYGDVTGDGEINEEDIARMQQKISEWNVNYVYDETADLNGDGRADEEDLARLQQYVSGWNVKLGKAS